MLSKGHLLWFEPIVTTRDEQIAIGAHSRVDSFCKLEGGRGLRIGQFVHIASFCHLNIGGGELIIEDGAACASGVKIVTGGNRPNSESCSASAPLDQQVLEFGRVRLARNACLYTNVVVLPNITIGEGARVAAGSVVTKDVPPYEIWAGVPARKIGDVRIDAPSWSPADVIEAEKERKAHLTIVLDTKELANRVSEDLRGIHQLW